MRDIQDLLDKGSFHLLKTANPYFKDIGLGLETFDLRKNDRNFKVNDLVVLGELTKEKDKFTGNVHLLEITYIVSCEKFGLSPDYCIFSFNLLSQNEYDFELSNFITSEKIAI